MTAMTDEELLQAIELTHYRSGLVPELVRRYRDARFRLSRIATEAAPATQVAPAAETPVAGQGRGKTHCRCGSPLDDAGRCTAVTDWGEHREVPLTAADVLELCQRVLDTSRPRGWYEDVHTLAEWVLTTGLLKKP